MAQQTQVTAARETAMKLGLAGVRAKVVVAVDVSRAMAPIVRAGVVDELVPRLGALAAIFDDRAPVAYAFGERVRRLADLGDDPGFVERDVIRSAADYQPSCRFAALIDGVCRAHFPEDWDRPAHVERVGRLVKKEQVIYPQLSTKRPHPIVVIVVTAGDDADEVATIEALRRASRLPIFWQFVGVAGPTRASETPLVRRLDKLGNMLVDSCAYFEASALRQSEALFHGVLKELPTWLGQPDVRAMLSERDLGAKGGAPKRKLTEELTMPAPVRAARVAPTVQSEVRRVVVSELHDRIHGPILVPPDVGSEPQLDAQQRMAGRLARIRSQLGDGAAASEPPPRRPQPPARK